MIARLLLTYWAILTILMTVGGVIGWYQLRHDRRRVSLYLSRILIAESFRSALTFTGIINWAAELRPSLIYLALSTLGATLLCGAIWGWLLYLRGVINGGGIFGLLRRITMVDKHKEQDEEKPKPTPQTPAPTPPASPNSGDGTNADDGNDRGGVTDGPGK